MAEEKKKKTKKTTRKVGYAGSERALLENLIFRLLGLISTVAGVFWFWKTDFTLTTIGGVPTPIQFVLIIVGAFILVIPGPFLSVVSIFLPDGIRERIEKFSQDHIQGTKLIFTSGDEGQVLADKLNKAILDSKRRFYAIVIIVLIIAPALIFYFIKLNEYKKDSLIRQSDALVQALETNRLSFSSADRFREVLKDTGELKRSPQSSSGRIYNILEQLYGEEVKDEGLFQTRLSSIYIKEIKGLLDSNELDFKQVKPPLSDTDSKDAKDAWYVLLAIICNIEGRNGVLMEPYLYGRIALNEIVVKPSLFYHVSGWNYGGLFKSSLTHKIETDTKLVKVAFPNGFSNKWSLAARAIRDYKDYIRQDSSQLALVRYLNNVVEIHLALIYSLRVQGDDFQPETDQEIEIHRIKTENLDELFKRLHTQLAKTRNFLSDSAIDTTAAQLYSVEGEVNEKEQTAHSKDPKWNEEQRKKAIERIEHAYNPESEASKETFRFENREASLLTWLWQDDKTKRKLQEILK